MTTLYAILLFLALISFVAAAFGDREGGTRRINLNLIALGLAFWVAVPLMETLRAL